MAVADPGLSHLHQHLVRAGARLYVGANVDGLAFAEPQQALLVVGPPRSGKTSSLVIPNVLAAPGAVLSTSTKPDVLRATARTRAELGRCWLLDPTGTVVVPPGVTRVRWSPISASGRWDEALAVSHAMVGAARPGAAGGESGHWTERAEALLAPLLHAAALTGGDMRVVLHWVLRQELDGARAILTGHGRDVAADVLGGLDATDGREQSGIWSTAAGVLAAYRSDAALDSAADPNFDPRQLIDGAHGYDTVYVCAPARHQALVAPIVVAFVDQVRAGAYRQAEGGGAYPPVTLALDEVANIAPLPDLPAMVSEGGGQGVATLACLQDLSQARQRWGPAADGFLSLFGALVLLPGIGDLKTLQLVSELSGDVRVPVRSVSRSAWWSSSRGAETVSWSMQRQRRLPVDAVKQLPPGSALVLTGSDPPSRVGLPPWWATAPFASARHRSLAPAAHPRPPPLDLPAL